MDNDTATEQANVAMVAGFLDDDMPDWPFKLTDRYGMDLGDLYVSEANSCVTAGLYESYSAGIGHLFEKYPYNDDAIDSATSCSSRDNGLLRSLWLAEVNARIEDAQ